MLRLYANLGGRKVTIAYLLFTLITLMFLGFGIFKENVFGIDQYLSFVKWWFITALGSVALEDGAKGLANKLKK